jgi:hypothetical protein
MLLTLPDPLFRPPAALFAQYLFLYDFNNLVDHLVKFDFLYVAYAV